MTKQKRKPFVRSDVPMSESAGDKCGLPRTEQECVDALRTLAKENPDRVVTRNFFRVHGPFKESVWNRHFGTFHEFKRQAGIVLSRQAHALEKKIAVHASRDHYRAMSLERMGYGEKYLRPTDGKYKTVLVVSDLHDVECDPFYLRVLIDTAKRVQPDVICLGGDIFDLAEFGKYNVDPREWDVAARITFVHEFILAPLREACPNSQIDFIEGNHEGRLLRHLADNTPALRVLLSDLHGWTIPKLLGLDRFEINYIAKADLAACSKKEWADELSKNYKVYWDTMLVHHFPQGRNFGLPGCNGHHHRHFVWSNYNLLYGAFEWHQLGSGHRREASYCEGEWWTNGFMIANLNTESRSTAFDYVSITDFAVSGGKFYTRTEAEGASKASVWPGR